jgi:hypothetical protein
MRLALSLAAVTLLACGATVIEQPADGGGGQSTGDGGSADGGGPDGGGGSAWTVWPGQTYSHTHCDDWNQLLLLVEIWPEAEIECVLPAHVADALVLVIEAWDGSAGTFTVGEPTVHGAAHATQFPAPKVVTGTITIEPYADTPRGIAWDLDVGAGRTDLGPCGRFDELSCPRR